MGYRLRKTQMGVGSSEREGLDFDVCFQVFYGYGALKTPSSLDAVLGDTLETENESIRGRRYFASLGFYGGKGKGSLLPASDSFFSREIGGNPDELLFDQGHREILRLMSEYLHGEILSFAEHEKGSRGIRKFNNGVLLDPTLSFGKLIQNTALDRNASDYLKKYLNALLDPTQDSDSVLRELERQVSQKLEFNQLALAETGVMPSVRRNLKTFLFRILKR